MEAAIGELLSISTQMTLTIVSQLNLLLKFLNSKFYYESVI